MKKIYSLLVAAIATLTILGCSSVSAEPTVVKTPAKAQNVQVFTADNTDGKITPKVISDTMHELGLTSAGNNDMNKPFSLRVKHTQYKTYNLAY